jgi:hypothetical protein
MIKTTSKRQHRRNRHRYKTLQVIPQESITISFTIDTTEVEAAFAKFRERASFLPPVMSIAELTKLRNSPVFLPRITRKDIAIDTGSLRPSYTCETAWRIKSEEQVELGNDEVTWTRRLEAMELVSHQIYMGDPSCKFNARSHLIQCAVNPLGKCGECPHHEKNI